MIEERVVYQLVLDTDRAMERRGMMIDDRTMDDARRL